MQPQKKKHSNKEPLTYVSKYNYIKPGLFTDISKNIKQLKTMIQLKTYLTQ